MLRSRKRPGGIALAMLCILLIAPFDARQALSEPASPRELPPGEVERFRQLVQRYQTVYTHASVTGDVSGYPSVFYNDPAFDLNEYTPGCFPLIADERAATDAILSQFDSRPQGADTGLLSCMIAEMVRYHGAIIAQQVEVTQANDAEATAAWGDPIHVLEAIYLDATHARFSYAGSPLEEVPEVVFHFLFTNVDGKWLISAMWNSFPGFE